MSKHGQRSTPKAQLRAERLARQWSQQELAERLGTSVVTINRWERGVTTPTPYYRLKLCALFEKDAVTLGLLPAETVSSASVISQAQVLPSQLTQQPSSTRLPQAPSPIWQLPFRRNPFFTGRDTVLDGIYARLKAHPQQALALTGLGGIGKTQTALEYAYRFQRNYQAMLWLRAETETALQNDCLRIAATLNPTESASGSMALRNWLDQHEHWLLILDNVEDYTLVEPILPLFLHGHVLITTRTQAAGPLARCIDLRELSQEESVQLLLRRSRYAPAGQISEENQQALQALSQALAGLPLALDQAGAYIEETGCSFTDYLEHYHRHRLALLNRRGAHPMEHPASVVATVSLCLEQLMDSDPAAVDLLHVCSFLPPEGISEEFLHAGASRLGPRLSALREDQFLFDEAIGKLRALSLLYRQATRRRLILHRLIQAVLYDLLNEEEKTLWAGRIVQAVNLAFPEDITLEQIQRCEQLLPLASCCKTLIVQQNLRLPECRSILYRTGRYLIFREQYVQAEAFLSLALQQQELDSPQTACDLAATLQELGLAYEAEGNYAQAETAYQRALTLYEYEEAEIPSEHAVMIDLLCHQGRLALRLGHYQDAEKQLQRVISLSVQRQALPVTALITSLQLISTLYHQLGRYNEAEHMLQRGTALCLRYFGSTDPTSLEFLCQLSIMYTLHGKQPQASRIYRQCRDFMVQAVEQGNQLTTSGLKYLGIMYGLQDERKQAETLLRQTLAICRRSFGLIHPDTADCMRALATLARRQNNYSQAEALLLNASTILTQFYGPDHPETGECLTELGIIYMLQGKYQQAEELLLRATKLLEEAFGREHLSSNESLHALALVIGLQGKHEQAKELFEGVQGSPSWPS